MSSLPRQQIASKSDSDSDDGDGTAVPYSPAARSKGFREAGIKSAKTQKPCTFPCYECLRSLATLEDPNDWELCRFPAPSEHTATTTTARCGNCLARAGNQCVQIESTLWKSLAPFVLAVRTAIELNQPVPAKAFNTIREMYDGLQGRNTRIFGVWRLHSGTSVPGVLTPLSKPQKDRKRKKMDIDALVAKMDHMNAMALETNAELLDLKQRLAVAEIQLVNHSSHLEKHQRWFKRVQKGLSGTFSALNLRLSTKGVIQVVEEDDGSHSFNHFKARKSNFAGQLFKSTAVDGEAQDSGDDRPFVIPDTEEE